MKKYKRVLSLICILALAISIFHVSSGFAATAKKPKKVFKAAGELALKKKIVQNLIKENLKKKKALSAKKKNSARSQKTLSTMALTEQTYAGTIDEFSIQFYHFSTDGGTIQISDLDDSDFVDYYITNDADTSQQIQDGDTIPAGNYTLTVYGISNTKETFNLKISGIPLTNAPIDMPTISLTKPGTGSDVTLSKGTTSTNVVGTSQSSQLEYSTNWDGSNMTSISPTSSFDFQLNVQDGDNPLMFHATSASGNELYKTYLFTVPSLKRINGADRYEVAANVYREIGNFLDLGTIYIATGLNYPDGLAGSPLAFMDGAPILLTTTDSLPSSTQSAIQALKPTRAVILGGTDTVSTNVETQLRNLGVTTIERVDGANRYAVSANIAERMGTLDSGAAIVVNGTKWADTLSSASIAANGGMPILYVTQTDVPTEIENYIKNHSEINKFYIVGGADSVSDSVKTELQQLRPGSTVDRIDGADRYQVAINVINYFNFDLDGIVFNNGTDYPDGLSSAPFAGYEFSPILLTQPDQLTSSTSTFVDNHINDIKSMYIIGGTISTSVEQALYNKLP